MAHTKNLIKLVLFISVFCFSQTAFAGEAVRLYLELSSSSATVLPYEQGQDYLRGRMLALDGDNELATTFGGLPLSSAQLVLQSSFGEKVRFAMQSATVTAQTLAANAALWETAAETVSVTPSNPWQEFAISYDGQAGTDTLIISLQQGSSTISAQATIEVSSPLANCYVVRTGGLLSLEVLDEIPARKNDGGSIKLRGDSTIIDVYGAFYYSDTSDNDVYVYTDNIPAGAEEVKISGGESTTTTLVEGHSQISVTVDTVSVPSAVADAYEAYADGVETTFSAEPVESPSTRWIGNRSGDVNADEALSVNDDSDFFHQGIGDSDYKGDISMYRARRLVSRIGIIGLPVNEVTSMGVHLESGFGTQHANPGVADIDPDDAFKLSADPTKQSTKFKVPGVKDNTFIYGAIVGFDEDGDPAPFALGLTATFYLKHENGATINNGSAILRAVTKTTGGNPDYYSGNAVDTTIAAKYGYQSFLPFQITATAATADGSTASITNLYIDKIELYDSLGSKQGEVSSNIFGSINEEAEGVDFIAQDTIASITLTDISSLDEKNAGDDAEVTLQGKGDENSFKLRVLNDKGDTIKIGLKGKSTVLDDVSIKHDSDNIAERDVAFFSAVGDKHFYFLFTGDDEDTQVVQFYPPAGGDGIDIGAAEVKNFDPVNLAAEFEAINVLLDGEEEHDTVVLEDVVDLEDIFSNAYGATGATLEDSKISVGLQLPSDNGSASSTAFPGATAKVDDSVVELRFDLEEIREDQDTAIMKVETEKADLSTEVTLNLKTPKQAVLKSIFVPVPGLLETPIEMYLADQDGAAIAPVTITAANSGDATAEDGNVLNVEMESENGTINSVKELVATLSTVEPRTVIAVEPDDDKTAVLVTAEVDNYEAGSLLLEFVPDFQKPFVSDIVEQDCSIEILLQDNHAVDTSESEVVVLDSGGETITGTLTRVDVDNGTTGTIRLSGFPITEGGAAVGYSITIVARDIWGNEREVTRTFSVGCAEKIPGCVDVDPAYALFGSTVEITITGENTNFLEGETSVAFDCDNATVEEVAVQSSTELVVVASITASAPSIPDEPTVTLNVSSIAAQNTDTDDTGGGDDDDTSGGSDEVIACDISIVTGSEEITCEDSFELVSKAPADECVSIEPSTIPSGATSDIVITGKYGEFDDSTTVAFDCADITVNSVSADSPTELVVNVTSNPSSATVTCNASVTVGSGTFECPELSLSPLKGECFIEELSLSSARPRLLPYIAVITGSSDCSFGLVPSIDFGTTDISVVPLFRTSNSILCLVFVRPGTASGTYDVTVDSYGGASLMVE